MAKKSHYHQYKLTKVGSKGHRVYKCFKPGCPHFKEVGLVENAIAECPRCDKPYVLTKDILNKRPVKPYCEDCVRRKTEVEEDISAALNLIKDL